MICEAGLEERQAGCNLRSPRLHRYKRGKEGSAENGQPGAEPQKLSQPNEQPTRLDPYLLIVLPGALGWFCWFR